MKRFIALLFMPLSLWAEPNLHLDLEMSSQELAKILESRAQNISTSVTSDRFLDIQEAGKRNLDWLKEINRHRQIPISLYVKGELNGIPIDAPKTYSSRSIRADFSVLKKTLPAEMAEVLFSNSDFPKAHPFDEETYRKWAQKIDRSYQISSRWLLMEPYLIFMERQKRFDVRGYYFLTRTENLREELSRYLKLEEERKIQLKEWLLQLCFLDPRETERTCKSRFESGTRDLYAFYERYINKGHSVYNSFFDIPDHVSKQNLRSQDHSVLLLNFESNSSSAINGFLKVNVEDEWQWNGLKIQVVFDQPSPNLVKVKWVAGSTPHVDGLGGLNVTMDANSSLDDWDTQWTIRHELGHVIGFPDCYLEFYDSEKQEIVSYQIDVEDLMCSRKGRMNQRMADGLIHHYQIQ